MPHINRVRVNNVRYNFGTQYYDDFIMRFDGKNVLYDLANGGGKSVLLLLLLQNLIPNCTLDEKQPVEKLFRGENGSNVIHSLIEWKLDEHLIKDDYRYMLTGFCARKAKEDDDASQLRDAASIEYFNYVIFYRHYHDNDIVNLPLSDGKQRITYPGLKNYLKNLGRQDYNLQVHVFERKGEYQRFISRYGLYESEWEIVRGINKTEGHVRTYFESNYRTTRKVVENLLIEEIIQKAFAARTSVDGNDLAQAAGTEMMADTLYQIKDQLTELSKRQDEMAHYDGQQEALNAFGERIGTLDDMYQQESELEKDMAKTYQTALARSQMCDQNLAESHKEQDAASKKMSELSRQMETVRIQSGKDQLEGLEKMTQDYRNEIEEHKEKQALVRDDLNLRESMNDYAEYLEEQKMYQAASQAVSHASSDEQEVFNLLSAYAACYKERMEKRIQLLEQQMDQDRSCMYDNEEKIQENALLEKEQDRMLAVLEHRIESLTIDEAKLSADFAMLRDEAGILVVEDAKKLSQKAAKSVRDKEKELENCRQEAAKTIEDIQKGQLRLGQILPELKLIGNEIDEIQHYISECDHEREEIEKLVTAYQADSAKHLEKKILEQYRKLIYEIETKQEKLLGIEQKLARLQQKNPMLITPETESLMNYIRSCHGITCIFGGDYIQSLDQDARKTILERLPMLPYAIVLQEGFSKLASDMILEEKDFGDYLIPILGLESLVSERKTFEKEPILFAGKGRKIFFDEKLLEKEIKNLEDEKEELAGKILRLQDEIDSQQQDLARISVYNSVYGRERAKKEKMLGQLKADQKNLTEEEISLKEEIKTSTSYSEQLKEKNVKLISELEKLQKEAEGFEGLERINSQITEVQQQIQTDRRELVKLTNSVSEISDKQEMLVAQNRQLEESLRNQQAIILQLRDDWDTNWQIYQARENIEIPVSVMQMEEDELVAAFVGAKEAYEKDHVDLDVKRQLIDSYSRSMQRLMKSIMDRNQDPQYFEQLNETGHLVITGEEQILSLRNKLALISDDIQELTQKLNVFEAEMNQLYGSVNQAVSNIEERYGSFEEVDLQNQSYEDYIKSLTALMDDTAGAISRSERKSQMLTREYYYLDGLRKDLERMLKLYRVSPDITDEIYADHIDLKTKYEDLTARHEYLQRQHFSRREAFEKDKAKTIQTLNQLGAHGLAQEISEQMSLPENIQMAKGYSEAITETVQLIEIEKTRVEKNMTDLLSVKSTFEDQCLQVCMNIKTELDKLPKMSVITIDGERVQMLGLTVPYIKESFYKQQMSDYIDQIVSHLDQFEAQEEKIKYIRQQLEWKHLFAVIVTDMNAIRLTLYKRERIREQSRYLKYEEAVGSTGQSQGIYIQFLIAIIHYISSINAGGSAKDQLKKVIFIDNPFGAAKDTYIWDPIFALLKTNNVQLVVPARGATPAITGMFDVNYVLGQKLMGQGQQTIVVDYHSNIVVEDLEYVKIDYEQQVFDFV